MRETKVIVAGSMPAARMLSARELSTAFANSETARRMRIGQLEQFIRDHGLEVPPCREGWEI